MWKEAKVDIGDIEVRQCFTSVIHIIILEGKQANFASCKMCSISKSYYVTNNRGRENPAKCPLNPYLNYKTFVFNATTSLICIYMNSKACK